MKKRVVSGIVMAIIAIPLLILGNYYFDLFMLLLGEMILYEFFKFLKLPNIIKLVNFLGCGLCIINSYLNTSVLSIIMIFILLNLSLLVFINNNKKYNYKDAFMIIGLVIFVGLSFNNLIIVRKESLYLLIYLLAITIITDSFALFIGTLFGHTKLAPKISPNKTVEGFVGGCIVGTILASLVYILLMKPNNIFLVIIMSFYLAIVGEFGDLIKSSIKRYEGIKDFGNLIPGHGGIMDRLDSIIFVVNMYVLIVGLI